MAILDRIRDRNGVSIDFGDLADTARDHAPDTSGLDPAAWANSTADSMNGAAKDAADVAKGAMKDASESVREVSDAARERMETVGELIRDLIREWNRSSSSRKTEKRLDEIAQRLRAGVPAAQFKSAVTRLERELPDTDKDRYDRAYERGRAQTRTIFVVGGLAIGIGAGIAAAMLMDTKRRAQIVRIKDQVAQQATERTHELTTRAKAIAAERGIGQPAKPSLDPTGTTTDREMVPVMPVGEGVVTDPSSTILEPLPGAGGGIEPEIQSGELPSTVDGTGDRAVTASHG
jgi:hypothetical protein